MAYLATQQRPSTSAPGDGSRTIVILEGQPREEDSSVGGAGTVGALRLRGGPRRNRQHVAWGESVIDNEGCGRKKSKICCIYHRPKRFDESSDEDSSDSGSDTDASCDYDGASHSHSHSHSHSQRPPNGTPCPEQARENTGGGVTEVDCDRNAYESLPSSRKGKKKANS